MFHKCVLYFLSNGRSSFKEIHCGSAYFHIDDVKQHTGCIMPRRFTGWRRWWFRPWWAQAHRQANKRQIFRNINPVVVRRRSRPWPVLLPHNERQSSMEANCFKKSGLRNTALQEERNLTSGCFIHCHFYPRLNLRNNNEAKGSIKN